MLVFQCLELISLMKWRMIIISDHQASVMQTGIIYMCNPIYLPWSEGNEMLIKYVMRKLTPLTLYARRFSQYLLPIPDSSFPHAQFTRIYWMDLSKLIEIMWLTCCMTIYMRLNVQHRHQQIEKYSLLSHHHRRRVPESTSQRPEDQATKNTDTAVGFNSEEYKSQIYNISMITTTCIYLAHRQKYK